MAGSRDETAKDTDAIFYLRFLINQALWNDQWKMANRKSKMGSLHMKFGVCSRDM